MINEQLKTLNDAMKLINQIGVPAFSKAMGKERARLEELLFKQLPFNNSDTISLIIDYATILNSIHSNPFETTSTVEVYEHLLAACFSVGYVLGIGEKGIGALPVMALSGAHLNFGKEVLDEYLKNNKLNKDTKN